MKHINVYITEAWSGVKQQSIKADIEAWCEEMGIQNYTINSQGEIDVDGNINLRNKNFKELPYKFGTVTKSFDISSNKNLTSLKNCPNKVNKYFRCSYCPKLESLEGCPKKVSEVFYCSDCKGKFTANKAYKLCKTPCVYNKL